DGSIPSLFNRNSKRYAGPITIDHIMIIRAWAAKPGYEPTNLDTHTYIFRNDVLHQPQFPDGFPESWGSGPGVNAVMPGLSDYEVDPRIRDATYVDRDGETFTLDDALRSIPSLAVTLPIKTLLGPETGLHALARNKGAEWERPISLEYFEESGNRAFQINGGIRMQGGWNRLPESFKKSFRFYFRSEYGDSKLEYPLFPDSNVTTFDTLILRAGNGKAWSSPWRPLTGSTNNSLERVTYLRDQLPRDLQHDMGHPTSHGRFVHLYINGLYWGLYNLVERVDEWFGPGYFGGDEEDYDVIKWIRSEGMVISAGNDDAWQDLLRLVRSDIELQETYEAAAALVDLENLIDYMLINFYIGNSDWPDNNSYTFRKRTDDGRFRFVSWDAEESLVETSANSLSKKNTSTCAEVFQRLRRNEEFQVLLKDRIAKHFSAGGILTDAYVSQRHLGRAREIDRAIVGESARWGDLLRSGQPYTRDHWMDELDNLEDNFFGRGDGSREEVTYNQMRSSKWTSPEQAPRLTLPEGFVPRGSEVAISKASIFAIGTPYFTTDGSDPRLFGGELNPNAIQGPQTITIDASTTIKARLLANERWSPIVEVRYSIGIPASGENITISELMYHPATDEAPEYLELANHSDQEVNLQGST
ncbi:MAG: CotH kinase family protein, partial [Verrucomicrobiales bacterium]